MIPGKQFDMLQLHLQVYALRLPHLSDDQPFYNIHIQVYDIVNRKIRSFYLYVDYKIHKYHHPFSIFIIYIMKELI